MTARKLRTFEEKLNVFMSKFARRGESKYLFHAKYPYVSQEETEELFKRSKEIEATAYTLLQTFFQHGIPATIEYDEVKVSLGASYPSVEAKGFDSALLRAYYQLCAETFFAQTTLAFSFLETEYDYRRREGTLSDLDDFRDVRAEIRYTGSRVGISVSWALADGWLSVSLVEFVQPGVFPARVTYIFPDGRPDPAAAKGINLYTLAEMQGQRNDPDFLLPAADDYRTALKNGKIIQTRMPEVLTGLARATQTYAISVLQGDTRIFPQVMEFYRQKRIRAY